jgi:hypothetical protein
MKEAFVKKFSTLSDADKGLCKMIFHNTIAYDYEEVEEKGEIVPYIVVKSIQEKYKLLDYISNKKNIFDTTGYIMGCRRK